MIELIIIFLLGDGKLISRCTLISFQKVGSGGREKNNIMILFIFWKFNLKSRVEHWKNTEYNIVVSRIAFYSVIDHNIVTKTCIAQFS